MTIELPGWRVLLAFAALGSAGALSYCGDWRPVAIAAAAVLVVAVAWVLRELAATREMMRGAVRKHRRQRGFAEAAAGGIVAAAIVVARVGLKE